MLNLEKISAVVQEELSGLAIQRARCSLARSHLSRCRACQEVCPTNAITLTEEGPQVENCLECGLCAAQCPTGALVWKKPTFKELLAKVERLVNSEGIAYLYCSPGAGWAKDERCLQVPCLGSIPWECWLEILLLGDKVKLLLSPSSCQNCQVSTGQQVWQKELKKAQEIIGHEISIVSQIPVSKSQKSEENQKHRERREFFSLIFNLAKNTPAKILANGQNLANSPSPSEKRQVLIDFIQKNPEHGAKIQVPQPFFNEGCQFCGACSLLCPQGALRQEEGEEGKKITLDGQVCSGCGLCGEICYHQGIELMLQPADKALIPHKATFIEK